MARPLLERFALDLKPTGRLADCKRDLAEAEAERAEIDRRIADCEKRAEDPSTPEDDARLALQQAADWRFHAKRLDRAIADVREAITAKEADAAYAERRNVFEAAKAEHDALVERWRALAPVYDQMMSLLADTVANDWLIAQVNQHRPRDEAALKSSELQARGALNETNWPNSIGQNGEPFQRLTEMEFPKLFEPGFAWSLRESAFRSISFTAARRALADA